ncbi:hypothetical protein E4T50_05121 [Aureobasidium sp. EXF-12298]|nr:hypothetical protein E4T50_05121 [Aureobasidium sp. EXF-12298]
MADTQEGLPARYRSQQPNIFPTRTRSTRGSRGRNSSRDAAAGAFDSGDDGYGSMRSQQKSLDRAKDSLGEDPYALANAQAPKQIRATREGYIPPQEEGDVSAEETAGCFSFFGRKKKKTPTRKTAEKPLNARPAASTAKEPPVIRPGGGGIVPMTDAPLSAPNGAPEAGRRVRVECNGKGINLPVEHTTSAADLIASASNCLSEPIDLKTSVLLENFTSKVDVTRPLRRYEYVFDVMNSWDDDHSGSLQIVPARVLTSNASNLSLANVPREKPRESSFLMQHSQKPGSWSKRLITIRQDGQLVAAKPNKDSETTNIGHLTDFDIYNPTARFASKMLKPPKKICYAIKSQQKSNIFQQDSKSVYVHFFCTSDETLATSFHDAVQGWRSWYLHHVKDEGKKKSTSGLGRSSSKATKQSKQPSHAPQPSTGSMDAHYQLGSYKPLVDLEKFDRPSSSRGQDTGFGAPARKPSVRERTSQPSVLSQQQKLADDEPLGKLAENRRLSFDGAAEREAFNGDGLLGRSYSTRQKAVAEREAAAKNPWVTGPSLLSGNQAEALGRQSSVKRTGSTRRTDGHGTDLKHRPSTRERLIAADDGLKRSGSTRAREPTKPLVDITPTYKPPPQHVKKGRGVHPDQVGPGGLIDNATTPDQPYQVPSSQDWRGGRANVSATANAGVSRQRSLAHRPGHETDEAFTGHGLLNNARGGYDGKASIGRGVASGNRNAREPLINVNEESKYVPGSLLNQVARHEREEGRGGPIIDRNR